MNAGERKPETIRNNPGKSSEKKMPWDFKNRYSEGERKEKENISGLASVPPPPP